MAKLIKNKTANYTVIDNAIFKNKALSLKSKGLLCLMLSLPDNWDYSIAGLAVLSSDGESAVRSGLKELEDAGYFKRRTIRENGKIADVEYIISETPCFLTDDFLVVENQQQENLILENRPQLNTNIINKHNNKIKIPPTIEEVQDYCNERRNNINAEQFIDYYESKGWLVGKTKMKDWRAAVRTWERNGFSNPPKNNSFNNYDQRETDYSKIEKLLMKKN